MNAEAFTRPSRCSDPTYLETARSLVKAAHPEETPSLVDPFSGGGSIPLEALRIGCDSYASDINPVACLILKVMLEDIPRHGAQLASELRKAGARVKMAAEKELAQFYPPDKDGATPIVYLWARTVRCETPNCGAEIPLVRSFWLAKRANRRRALRHRVIRHHGKPPRLEFEIFEPKDESEIQSGTISRAKATCPCCNSTLLPERVRTQLATQSGGGDVQFDNDGHRIGGAFLLAVVALSESTIGRQYRLASSVDYQAVWRAHQRLAKILAEWESDGREGFCPVPDEDISLNEIRRISVPIYGIRRWGDLFTARQKLALVTVARMVREQARDPDSATRSLLAIVVNRCADYWSSLCSWHLTGEKVNHTFGRQALPMVWDYAEPFGFSDSSGNYDGALDWVAKFVEAWPGSRPGQVQAANATEFPLPDETAHVWFTDPPYYDAVPYAHLADFFFVWLRRTLSGSQLFGSSADLAKRTTPKDSELVVDRPHSLSTSTKDARFYEAGVAKAFAEGRRVLREDGVGSVVFAHKTTEGWEALLSGMIRGGWTITGSWPVATEMGARLNARDTASLATSVHLVCRPRTQDTIGDWGEVLREIPKRVGDWMARLEGEGVRGADLVFACIGPALEIFSRYARVETPDGTEKTLAEYLERVWEVVGRVALEQILGTPEAQARNGAAGALEEDARLTALFLWTVQATDDEAGDSGEDEAEESSDEEDEEGTAGKKKPGFTLIYDVARQFAQPLGIHLSEWEGRIVETKKGVVRLLPVRERSQQLFGEAGTDLAAERIERVAGGAEQLDLFSTAGLVETGLPEVTPKRGRKKGGVADEALKTRREATTLDRVHAAMLLQASGRANALRSLLRSETERSPDFLRLANSLSALYPKESEEKRLLDAMLLATPR